MRTGFREGHSLPDSLARNLYRQQLHSAAAAVFQKTMLIGSAPREDLVRVHRKLACHSRHRNSGSKRRLDDPTLLLPRETLSPTTFARTHRVRSTTPESTRPTQQTRRTHRTLTINPPTGSFASFAAKGAHFPPKLFHRRSSTCSGRSTQVPW